MRYGWSLDPTPWRQYMTLASECGLRWRRTWLDQFYRDAVPERPGVYAMCARPSTDSQPLLPTGVVNIVYIGKADNLRTRFLQHTKTSQPEIVKAKHLFASPLEFAWSAVPLANLFKIESLLIACFGPSANRQSGRQITAKIGEPRRP